VTLIVKTEGVHYLKKIYEAGGYLNKDYMGQISYTVCLPIKYEKLVICLSFDKQKPTVISDELMQDFLNRYENGAGLPSLEELDIQQAIMDQKTEIHVTAELNGHFIGGIHKQLPKRYLLFSSDYASKGCIPQIHIQGMLKVTIIVFRILYDNTPYTLTVWGS